MMMKVWQLTSLLVFAATAGAAAQRPSHTRTPTPHVRTTAPSDKHSAAETRGAESAEHLRSFRGVAEKLNTTPEALRTAYEQARSTNPKLTAGQLIAANMPRHHISEQAITSDDIRGGL